MAVHLKIARLLEHPRAQFLEEAETNTKALQQELRKYKQQREQWVKTLQQHWDSRKESETSVMREAELGVDGRLQQLENEDGKAIERAGLEMTVLNNEQCYSSAPSEL